MNKEGLIKLQHEKGQFAKGSGFGGFYTRLPSTMRQRLNKAMPPEAITKHPTMTFLSTIKSIYVAERMNDVFGVGGWDLETEIVKEEVLIHYVGKDKVKTDYTHVTVCGRIYFREFDLYGPIQFGGHDEKTLMAVNAYKGAVTDCLSKCASLLEIGIQVFKGNPADQTPGSKSMRLDEHAPADAKKKPAPKKEAAKKAEAPVPPEQQDMGDEAQTGAMAKPSAESPEEAPVLEETPAAKTEEELAADAELAKLQTQHKFLFGKAPNANVKIDTLRKKVEKEQAKRKAAEAEAAAAEQEEEKGDGAPFAEEETPAETEPEEVDEEIVDLEFLKAKVDGYTSATALGEEAKGIDVTAGDANFSEEDRSELRNYINAKYTKLNK